MNVAYASLAGRWRLAISVAIVLGACLPASPQDSPMRPMIVAPQQPRVQPGPLRPAPAARPRANTQQNPVTASVPRPGDPAADERRQLGPPPAYEKPLVDLSEAIGSLAFLTSLCAPSVEPNAWQKRMDALLESEGEVTSTREKMIGAYNQGFGTFQTTYRQCTDAAKAARALLVRDAARIARDIDRRYGS